MLGLAEANGPFDDVEESLILERFLQEIDGAFLHGLNGEFDIAVAGHENDWKGRVQRFQSAMQFQPADARHADVEYQTAAAGQEGRRSGEEVLGRFVADGVPAGGFEQERSWARSASVARAAASLAARGSIADLISNNSWARACSSSSSCHDMTMGSSVFQALGARTLVPIRCFASMKPLLVRMVSASRSVVRLT